MSGFDMYVFRDGRRQFAGRELLSRTRTAFERASDGSEDAALRALIAAGELECALSDAAQQDARWANAAMAAARATEAAARAVCGESHELVCLESSLAQIEVPAELSISVMEGFAYYALHPRKLLKVVESGEIARDCAVIGIRSIGTPLSAVLAAALGDVSRRITVRPTGHPYDRHLDVDDAFRSFAEANSSRPFVIVDEGPGLSGSSFLATAEALERLGIVRERITLLGSRTVSDASRLRTAHAGERWPRFRFVAMPAEPVLPEGATSGIGGGWWRREFLSNFTDQPAAWTQLEMAKYLSDDRRTFYKFEGFGHFGDENGERARKLHDAGFGAPYLGNQCGFGIYRLVQGRALSSRDLTADVIARLADYCAFRGRDMKAVSRETSHLPEMMRCNWRNEFGEDLPPMELAVERLVTADARMMPHEWMATAVGVLKLDAISHGDDHFFPGPCNIAWDVAGAIVEWEMDDDARERFVVEYERRSDDKIRERLDAYLLAYAVFRMAWSKMAWGASAGEFDAALLERDYRRYREVCEKLRQVNQRRDRVIAGIG